MFAPLFRTLAATGPTSERDRLFTALAEATQARLFRLPADGRSLWPLTAAPQAPAPDAAVDDWIEALVHAHDRERVRDALAHALATRQPLVVEHREAGAEGDERWVCLRAVPRLRADGAVEDWIAALHDIGGERRTAQALRDCEARIDALQRAQAEALSRERWEPMRVVANLVPDLLWRGDVHGGVEWYNDRWYEYTGQLPEHALGSGWTAMVHPDDLPQTLAIWRDAMRQPRPLTREHRLRRHDGTYRWFLVRAEPLRDTDGRVSAWLGSATDVHEQREALGVLERRVNERTHALRQLLIHVETVQDDERRRIARELHDSFGQYLSSLSLALGELQRCVPGTAARVTLERSRDLLLRLDRELDRMVFTLRPTALEDCGLSEGIAAYVDTWSELTGTPVDLELHGLDEPRLPAGIEGAVFRVVQEALTNVAKHAGASRVAITLERRRRQLVGSVEDDGAGFTPAEPSGPAQGRAHWGLLGMQERIEALGGSFSLESAPGRGTTVLWRLPLPAEGPA